MCPTENEELVRKINEQLYDGPRRVTWQLLLEMMMATDMTPHEILCHLRVPPSRGRKLLASKRLHDKLELMQSLSTLRARHRSICFSDNAITTLLRLAQNGRDESARGASRDLLAMACAALSGRFGAPAPLPDSRRATGLLPPKDAPCGPARLAQPSPPTKMPDMAKQGPDASSRDEN